MWIVCDYNYMYINICYCIIKWYHYFVTTEKTRSWERSYDRRKNRSTGGWSRERPRSHGNATPTDWPTQPTRMVGSGSQGNRRHSPDELTVVILGLRDWHDLKMNYYCTATLSVLWTHHWVLLNHLKRGLCIFILIE